MKKPKLTLDMINEAIKAAEKVAIKPEIAPDGTLVYTPEQIKHSTEHINLLDFCKKMNIPRRKRT